MADSSAGTSRQNKQRTYAILSVLFSVGILAFSARFITCVSSFGHICQTNKVYLHLLEAVIRFGPYLVSCVGAIYCGIHGLKHARNINLVIFIFLLLLIISPTAWVDFPGVAGWGKSKRLGERVIKAEYAYLKKSEAVGNGGYTSNLAALMEIDPKLKSGGDVTFIFTHASESAFTLYTQHPRVVGDKLCRKLLLCSKEGLLKQYFHD